MNEFTPAQEVNANYKPQFPPVLREAITAKYVDQTTEDFTLSEEHSSLFKGAVEKSIITQEQFEAYQQLLERSNDQDYVGKAAEHTLAFLTEFSERNEADNKYIEGEIDAKKHYQMHDGISRKESQRLKDFRDYIYWAPDENSDKLEWVPERDVEIDAKLDSWRQVRTIFGLE